MQKNTEILTGNSSIPYYQSTHFIPCLSRRCPHPFTFMTLFSPLVLHKYKVIESTRQAYIFLEFYFLVHTSSEHTSISRFLDPPSQFTLLISHSFPSFHSTAFPSISFFLPTLSNILKANNFDFGLA